MRRSLFLIFCFFHTSLLFGQLTITLPISRMVLQRDQSNVASVQVAGSYTQTLDQIEVQAVARVAGQGTSTGWTILQANPTNGQFTGSITLSGGWYTLKVRGKLAGAVLYSDSVDRVGVGEVFAIMGHSDAQGSSCIIGGVDYCQTISGASDDRVSIVLLDQGTPEFQQYLNTANSDLQPGLSYPARFTQLPTSMGAAPFGNFAWLWGRFGDQLVSQLNVPVLIYNAGFGGSNMQQTYWAAYDIPFTHGFIKYSIRMPYANTRNLMNLYVPSTGIRAVLIQHGINDRGNPTDSTFKYYTKVIDRIRTEFNKPNLAFIIAMDSYAGGVYQNVRDAQTQVLALPNYKTFLGPDMDTVSEPGDRPDGIHFSPTGQQKAGLAWASAIKTSYLSAITPYPAETMPLAGISCAGSGQLTLTAPTSATALWTTGVYSPTITSGPGTYAVRARSVNNKIQFVPAVVVPTGVTPPNPVISTATGQTTICRPPLLLSSNASSSLWSTGSSNASIAVTTPGVYRVQAKNPVYSCLSGTTSTTIGQAATDLQLRYVASRRVVTTGDTVTLQLQIQNSSECDNGSLSWQAPMPANVQINNLPSSLTYSNGSLFGSLASLGSGMTSTQPIKASILAAGGYQFKAELTASANPARRATPGNGNGNGEVDETAIDVRTTAGGQLYSSANPNQQPLPGVLSSQPTPDPTKVDLSINMQIASRVVPTNTPFSLSLVITNSGGLTATSVTIGSLLPAGLSFAGSSTGVSAQGQQLSAQITSIAPGQSTTMTFQLTTTGSGIYQIPAQVTGCSQTDSDSTPGNGYTLGEDDETRIDLRTR